MISARSFPPEPALSASTGDRPYPHICQSTVLPNSSQGDVQTESFLYEISIWAILRKEWLQEYAESIPLAQ